jgi:hypothetical protein
LSFSFQFQALSLRAEGRAVHPISWSKEFLEAGKKLLAGDTARAACAGTFFNPFAFLMHALPPDFKAAPPAGLFAAIISIVWRRRSALR